MSPEPSGKKSKSTDSIKRNQLELLLDFLHLVREPMKRTHMIYGLQINHYQFQNYADMLLKFGMIEEIDKPFKGLLITPKGRTLLEIFDYPSHANQIDS